MLKTIVAVSSGFVLGVAGLTFGAWWYLKDAMK